MKMFRSTSLRTAMSLVMLLVMAVIGFALVPAPATAQAGPSVQATVVGPSAGVFTDQSFNIIGSNFQGENDTVTFVAQGTATTVQLFFAFGPAAPGCSGSPYHSGPTFGPTAFQHGYTWSFRAFNETESTPCYTMTIDDVPENTPTNTPTETPTETPINTATATATTEPTVTSTDVPVENGAVAVTIVMEDGSEIPANTIVCLDLDCRNLDDVVAAAAPSGTTITFTDVTPGDHLVSVTVNGSLAASETVTVAPGATTNVTIVLPAADATPNIIVNPPGDGSGQPVDPDGNDDGGDSGDGGSNDGGSSGGGSGSGGGAGSAPVTSLPSTGTGDETPASALMVLLGGVLLIAIAGGLVLRSRRS